MEPDLKVEDNIGGDSVACQKVVAPGDDLVFDLLLTTMPKVCSFVALGFSLRSHHGSLKRSC